MTPNALRMTEVFALCEPLRHLQRRLRDSQERFDAIRAFLPAALAAHIQPGQVDENGWALMVANAAVAAKLRQLQPRLEEVLKMRGWQVTSIRIKVQSGASGRGG